MNSTANSLTMEIIKPRHSSPRILPDEILINVFAYLSQKDVISLLTVSKSIHRVAWEQLYTNLVFASLGQLDSFKKCVKYQDNTAVFKTAKSIVIYLIPSYKQHNLSLLDPSWKFLVSFTELRHLTCTFWGPEASSIYMEAIQSSIDTAFLSKHNLHSFYFDALPDDPEWVDPLTNEELMHLCTSKLMLDHWLYYQNLETLKLRFLDFIPIRNNRSSMLTNLTFERCVLKGGGAITAILSSMVQLKRLSFIQCHQLLFRDSGHDEDVWDDWPTVGVPLRCIRPVAGTLEILEIQTLSQDCKKISNFTLYEEAESFTNFKRLRGLQISCEHFIFRVMNELTRAHQYRELVHEDSEHETLLPGRFSQLVFQRSKMSFIFEEYPQSLCAQLSDFFPPALEVLHLTVQEGLHIDYVIKNIALLIRNMAKIKDAYIPKLRRLTVSGMLERYKKPPRWFKPKCKAAGVELVWIRMVEGEEFPLLDMN